MRIRWPLAATAFLLLAIGRIASTTGQVVGALCLLTLLAAFVMGRSAAERLRRLGPVLATVGLTAFLLVPPAPAHPLADWPWLPGLVTALAVTGLLATDVRLGSIDWMRAHGFALTVTAVFIAALFSGLYLMMRAEPVLSEIRETAGAYGVLLGAAPLLLVVAALASVRQLIPRGQDVADDGGMES